MARRPRDWQAQRDHVTFRCGVCQHTWADKPDLVEPCEEQPDHPYSYFATCPICDASSQPQAQWERALLAAHQRATGPRTPEGLAASAANLAGHPTPEEALRTRFNAMKHGLAARTATYFPAKPDGYAHCQRCDVDRHWCAEQPACVKQTELFMLHHAAFEQRDPRVLQKVHSDLHAALVASLQLCLQEVLGRGVVIKTPKVVLDKDGEPRTLTFLANGELHTVYEYAANPVFKPIADLVTRLGLSLQDLGMTQRAADDEAEQLRGRLAPGAGVPSTAPQDFMDRMARALEGMPDVIKQARAEAARDPVLLEHQAQTGTGGDEEPAS